MKRALKFIDKKIDDLKLKQKEEKDEFVEREIRIITGLRDEIREKIIKEQLAESATKIATLDEIIWMFEDLDISFVKPTNEIMQLCTFIKKLRLEIDQLKAQ